MARLGAIRRAVVLVNVLTTIAGCDPIYGVKADGTLPAGLDPRCVTDTLSTEPAFANAQRIDIAQVPREDAQAHSMTFAWAYAEGHDSVIIITRTSDGWHFENSRLRMGSRLPEAEIDRFVPVMARVDATLEARCGLRILNQYRW